MKSLRSLVLVWYWDQREYILWIMAVTLPKTKACISAADIKRPSGGKDEGELDREVIMDYKHE